MRPIWCGQIDKWRPGVGKRTSSSFSLVWPVARLVLLALVLTTVATVSFGQAPGNSTKAPANQVDPRPSPQQPVADSEKGQLAVNPITGLVSSPASNFRPLTGKERLKLYWKQNYFSVGAYFGPAFSALVLDQATDSPPQWGDGFAGFGRRLASRTGSAILQGTVQAPLAVILHEDVRYISSKDHGGKRRLWHAVAYSFLTFDDRGHPTPNIANLAGYYASTAISTVWTPGKYSVARYTLGHGTEQIGLSVPVNLLQEFWPEITHKILRRP